MTSTKIEFWSSHPTDLPIPMAFPFDRFWNDEPNWWLTESISSNTIVLVIGIPIKTWFPTWLMLTDISYFGA